jgi:hypothetical protein
LIRVRLELGSGEAQSISAATLKRTRPCPIDNETRESLFHSYGVDVQSQIELESLVDAITIDFESSATHDEFVRSNWSYHDIYRECTFAAGDSSESQLFTQSWPKNQNKTIKQATVLALAKQKL